jgi:1,4-alpha-glucan branching enzyme
MSSKVIGSFTFVLHAHLPYVIAHGRWPHGMDWLNEAAAETYIPLLDTLTDLIKAGHHPLLTLGLTPVLCEQLADKSFKDEFRQYLDHKIQAAEEDQRTFAQWDREHLSQLASWWRDHYQRVRESYQDRYAGEIVGSFRNLQEEGHLEIITCAATHGYLPLLGLDDSVGAQIRVGVETYRHHFGRQPRGIWLPECAYRPGYDWSPPVDTSVLPKKASRLGVERLLAANDIEYFIADAALLKGGKAIGVYIDRFEALRRLWKQFESQYRERPEDEEKTPREIYLVGAPVEGKKPVAVFSRDPRTGLQVWSGEHGYPGDGWYLDFHKKHYPGGHRYWRVTSASSDLAEKAEYDPEKALERIPENSAHFVELVKGILGEYHEQTGKKGILCAPFDAELFGHWWFEGPQWLGQVLAQMDQDPELELTTCSRYLDEAQPVEVVSLPEGSWGQGGYHYIWLNEWTQWTWKHVYEDEAQLAKLLEEFKDNKDPKLTDILTQLARELLLLESSDWQFLISTWSARDYAELRLVEHHQTFQRLAAMAQRYGRGEWIDPGEWTFLGECKQRDNLFSFLKLKWFAPPKTTPS